MNMNVINCPYCEEFLIVSHEEGENFAVDELHQMECDYCGKNFVFTTHISLSYNSEKADCLNGSACNYKITATLPKAFSRMRCTMCGEERELTTEERKEHNIQTKEEFFSDLNINLDN